MARILPIAMPLAWLTTGCSSASATLAGGNLEGTLPDGLGARRQMLPPDTYYVFRTPTRHVTNLVDAGADDGSIILDFPKR